MTITLLDSEGSTPTLQQVESVFNSEQEVVEPCPGLKLGTTEIGRNYTATTLTLDSASLGNDK